MTHPLLYVGHFAFFCFQSCLRPSFMPQIQQGGGKTFLQKSGSQCACMTRREQRRHSSCDADLWELVAAKALCVSVNSLPRSRKQFEMISSFVTRCVILLVLTENVTPAAWAANTRQDVGSSSWGPSVSVSLQNFVIWPEKRFFWGVLLTKYDNLWNYFLVFFH